MPRNTLLRHPDARHRADTDPYTVPLTHSLPISTYAARRSKCWIYIVTNKPLGPLYTGVTNNLRRRMGEHKEKRGSQFAARYGLTRLVYFAEHPHMLAAIQREKNIKEWRRDWKLNPIEAANPKWDDLFEGLPF